MATPDPAKPKNPVVRLDNDEGLNVVSSAYDVRPQQARVNDNCVPLKKGGFTNRGGQVKVNTTQPSGNPEILVAKVFRRTTLAGTTTTKKIAVGADGKVYDYSTDPPTAILTGLTTTAFPDLAVSNGWLLLVNGVDEPKKWDMTNWRRWGIAAPSSAPTLAAGAAGAPNGTYRGRVTFVRKPNDIDPGHESSMGTISTSVTVANQKVEWTSIPTSADAQVNARNLYIEIGGQWYKVNAGDALTSVSINDNVTTTYSYDALDSVTVLNPLGRTDRDPPSSDLSIIEPHKDIIFASNGRILDWTPLAEFESFSRTVFGRTSNSFEPDDGTKITGLRSSTELIITKERSLFVRSGDDVTYAIEKKISGRGCVARNSLVALGTSVFGLAHDGFREFDGRESKLIMRNIQPLFYGKAGEKILDSNQPHRVVGTAYSTNALDAIVWSVPTATAQSTMALAYFYDFPTVDPIAQQVGSWYLWKNLDARFLFTEFDNTTKEDKLFEAGGTGFMRQVDTGVTDDGISIACKYRPGDEIWGDPSRDKRLRDCFFGLDVEDIGAIAPKVTWFVDGFTTGTQVPIQFGVGGIVGGAFDSSLFDASFFGLEGTRVGVAAFGDDPFHFIAPELTWTVSASSNSITWLGWVQRFLDAGYRRPQGA